MPKAQPLLSLKANQTDAELQRKKEQDDRNLKILANEHGYFDANKRKGLDLLSIFGKVRAEQSNPNVKRR